MKPLAGRPGLLVLVGGLLVARLAWHPGRALCGQMTVAGCLGVAVLVLGLIVAVSLAMCVGQGLANAVTG